MPAPPPNSTEEYFREYNEKLQERKRSYWRERYIKNKEAILEKNKRWAKNNRERVNQSFYKRVKAAHKQQPITRLLQACRRRAKNSGSECNLTEEWARARWTGACEVTGMPFTVGDGKTLAKSPSVDRIDNSKGYTMDNCRFVLWAVNRFKMNDTDEEMFEIAEAIAAASAKRKA